MNHCKYSKYLSEYVHKELDPHMKRLVEEHLPHCSTCKKEIKELAFIRQLSCSLSEEEMPVGLHERIMEKVRSQTKTKNRLNWLRYSVIPVAAVLLIFFLSQGIPNVISRRDNAVQEQNLIMATPGVTLAESPIEQNDAQIAASERREAAEDMQTEELAPPEVTDNMKNDEPGGNVKSDTDNKYSYSIEDIGEDNTRTARYKGSFGNYNLMTYITYVSYAIAACLTIALILLLVRFFKQKK